MRVFWSVFVFWGGDGCAEERRRRGFVYLFPRYQWKMYLPDPSSAPSDVTSFSVRRSNHLSKMVGDEKLSQPVPTAENTAEDKRPPHDPHSEVSSMVGSARSLLLPYHTKWIGIMQGSQS